MSDYPMLISNKLHSFRNFWAQSYNFLFIVNQNWFAKKQTHTCIDLLPLEASISANQFRLSIKHYLL